MIHGIIGDQRKTPSGLRKQLQSAGFANAETLVPQQGVGQGVIYAKTTLQTTTQIPISSATRQVLDLLKAEPLLSGDNAAQRLGLTRDGFYYHVKILRKAVGLRHTGGTKRGRWEVEKSGGKSGIRN